MMNQWRFMAASQGLRNVVVRPNEGLWNRDLDGNTVEANALFDKRVQETVRPLVLENYKRVRVGSGMSTGERIK